MLAERERHINNFEIEKHTHTSWREKDSFERELGTVHVKWERNDTKNWKIYMREREGDWELDL